MEYIENQQIKQDYQRFKKGIEIHVDALQYFIDVFTLDGNDMMLSPDLREEIKKLIFDRVLGPQGSAVDNNLPFFGKSLKRLWKKINK